jgi:ribose/xylose/arabinose/galactoside ABC-type transport system permease subunit
VFRLPGGGSEVFDFTNIGKLLIVIGLLLAGIGVALLLSGKIPWFGRLPGDFLFQGKHSSFYFPLTTSILISVVLTLIMWFINRR